MALFNIKNYSDTESIIPQLKLRLILCFIVSFSSYVTFKFFGNFFLPFTLYAFYIFYIIISYEKINIPIKSTYLHLYSNLYYILIFLFFTYNSKTFDFIIIIPALIYLLLSIIKPSLWHATIVLPLITITYLVHTIINLSYINSLIDAYKIGLIFSISYIPIYKLLNTLKYKDWKILHTSEETYLFIVQFILVEKLLSFLPNYNVLLIVLIFVYKSTLFIQKLTYQSNQNYFSPYFEENIVRKDLQSPLLNTTIIIFFCVSLYLTKQTHITGIILYCYVLNVITFYTYRTKFAKPEIGKIALMTNEIVKLSYEHTSNLNILNISTDKIYSRGYKQILKPDVKSDFQYLINSISCLIIIDIDNDQILKHIVNNDKVTFYYVYKEIPKTLANHSNIYNYNKTDFNLTSFIKDNNIEGALELEGKIKNYREKSSITLVQTIGLQDLHHMFKQIINIGDIQLRVLANINFIEMNLRYYYFINLSILNIKEELFNTVSMGLIIGKIREHFKSNFSSFEKTLDDENHEMWKSALNDIGYKEKLPKKLNFFSILNIAVYIRNKTLGHGSVTSISIDLLYIIDSIAILIHNEFSTQFSSIYFYYKHESVNSILNEISHKNIKIEVDEGFRYNRNTYKTPYIKISEGFIYVFDGVKNNEFEYINYINGKRIKPDLKRLSEFNS